MGIVSMLNHKNCTIYCTITFFVGVAKQTKVMSWKALTLYIMCIKISHPNTLQTVEVFNSLLHLKTSQQQTQPSPDRDDLFSSTIGYCIFRLCCKKLVVVVSSICATALSHRHRPMNPKQPSNGVIQGEIILLCVRTCGTPQLPKPGRNDVGAGAVRASVYRWVQAYAPELDKDAAPQNQRLMAGG